MRRIGTGEDGWVQSLTYLRNHRTAALLVALLLICATGVLDTVLPREIPLSLAYIVPLAILGAVSGRMLTLLAVVLCTAVSEITDAYVWNVREGIVRDSITLIAFAGIALYVREFFAKQETEAAHMRLLQAENAARVEAEEQLSLLIGNSALAILTMDPGGLILQANHAAERMFRGSLESMRPLAGERIEALLPSLPRVLARSAQGQSIRTMMQAQGLRVDGEPFLAEVWFSNYATSSGMRIAAMVVDISEEFRNREESIAEQLLSNARLAVGAMAHEMRNVVGAVQVMAQSVVQQTPELAGSASVASLRDLLGTLENMASTQLSEVRRSATRMSLNQFASELRVVAQAILAEHSIGFVWQVSADLPSVWADSEALMQVFLNLLRNAQQALEHSAAPEVRIASVVTRGRVEIAVSDNGPGVAAPERLFRPFQSSGPAAGQGAGLGLYLSRALLSSFRGDLRFVQGESGARFVVDLEAVFA